LMSTMAAFLNKHFTCANKLSISWISATRSLCQSASEVLFHESNGKLLVTLNRPTALNALNINMAKMMFEKLKKTNTDNSIKMVILKGAGNKAFCAGGDIRALALSIKNNDGLVEEFFREEYKLNYLIGKFRVPFVSLIDGIVMGGGVGLSVHGTFRVATERTVFAMPETAIGLFPDVGGSFFLPRLKNKLGFYLGLTGARLSGEDVFEAGIATHYVHSKWMPELQSELINAKEINSRSIKTILDSYHRKSITSDREFCLNFCLPKIEKLFSVATVEELFHKLKEDGSQWATECLETMKKMVFFLNCILSVTDCLFQSPTSLKITLRQLKAGMWLEFRECFQMEYRISQRCVKEHDLTEGIRAALLDKDKTPKWIPGTLEEVTEEDIDKYFKVLPAERELYLP
ncbi:3-hydroxyisobutyryl-CoA hydrolase, mitochondrial, partial [Trichinella sp. T8]